MNTTTPTLAELQEREKRCLVPVYARFPVAIVRGEGRYLWDVDGKKYVDFAAGIAVNSLGHAHPRIVDTISRQAATLIHTSNLYYTEPTIRLAERLVELFGYGRCFFCNSGAEANEGLFKFSRKFGQESGRFEIITAVNSFHGRTLAGIAATGQEKIKTGFAPAVPGFHHVPFNDLVAVQDAITPQTAAVLIEGIQGEGGITPATPAFLMGLRKLCNEKGILLLMDAVQCGHFRTGRFQSYQRILEDTPGGTEFRPDGISFAKGAGGGFPFGGFWLTEKYSTILGPGSHGTTYGASPLACSVANTVLDVIQEEQLDKNARSTGLVLQNGLQALVQRYPHLLSEVRGHGLMLGLELKDAPALKDPKLTAAQFMIMRLLKAGLLLVPSGSFVLRFLPPLNLTPNEAAEGVEILDGVLKSIA